MHATQGKAREGSDGCSSGGSWCAAQVLDGRRSVPWCSLAKRARNSQGGAGMSHGLAGDEARSSKALTLAAARQARPARCERRDKPCRQGTTETAVPTRECAVLG